MVSQEHHNLDLELHKLVLITTEELSSFFRMGLKNTSTIKLILMIDAEDILRGIPIEVLFYPDITTYIPVSLIVIVHEGCLSMP